MTLKSLHKRCVVSEGIRKLAAWKDSDPPSSDHPLVGFCLGERNFCSRMLFIRNKSKGNVRKTLPSCLIDALLSSRELSLCRWGLRHLSDSPTSVHLQPDTLLRKSRQIRYPPSNQLRGLLRNWSPCLLGLEWLLNVSVENEN